MLFCIYFSLKSWLCYGVALLCVVFLCCFVRKANGRGERFYDRELPLPTSRCCFFDGVSATDCFFVDVRFYGVFFVTSNILSDAMSVSMVIYRQSVRETLSSGLRFSNGLGVNTGSSR